MEKVRQDDDGCSEKAAKKPETLSAPNLRLADLLYWYGLGDRQRSQTEVVQADDAVREIQSVCCKSIHVLFNFCTRSNGGMFLEP